MEHLQLAQMLADLSAMEAAQKEASIALVSANKSITSAGSSGSDPATTAAAGGKFREGSRNEHQSASSQQRSASNNPSASTSSSPLHLPGSRLDALGRRIPLSRTQSASNSLPGTPKNEAVHEDEIDRARSIMALSDIRARLRDQDHTSLLRAREKMNALAARQQQQRPGSQAQKPTSPSLFVFPRDK